MSTSESTSPSATAPPLGPTGIVGAAMAAGLNRRIKRLGDAGYWTKRTASIQVEQLRALLWRGASTVFGKERDFARIAACTDHEIVDAYRQAVPHADYHAFAPYIRRMRDGAEPNVLWPGLVKDFAQTSGTTAGDKYMPVTKAMFRSNRKAAFDIFAHLSRFGLSIPRLTSGRCLFIGGSTALEVSDKGIATGDLSGLVTPLIKWPLTLVYTPGKDVALMSDWPEKIDAMARLCMRQDIRFISGMPSWTIVLMQRVLELAGQRGPYRTIKDVWPNLQVLIHGGVKYAPFEDRVRELYSGGDEDVPTRFELYPASEGFVAMQDTPGDPGLRLMSDIGIFYDFIPLEEIESPTARAFTCDEVEPGQRYVVCLTTCAGLWRYVLGDVVEFDTVPDRLDGRAGWGGAREAGGPCRLRIVGRHRHFINAFGENIIVENIENAVTEASREANLVVGEFTAAPVYPGPGTRAGLQIAVELDPPNVPPGRVNAFAEAFDASLKRQCVDYTVKRNADLGMAPPTVTPLAPGAFHDWMARRGKLGGQHKCPRCANHRDIIDDVLDAAAMPAGAS